MSIRIIHHAFHQTTHQVTPIDIRKALSAHPELQPACISVVSDMELLPNEDTDIRSHMHQMKRNIKSIVNKKSIAYQHGPSTKYTIDDDGKETLSSVDTDGYAPRDLLELMTSYWRRTGGAATTESNAEHASTVVHGSWTPLSITPIIIHDLVIEYLDYDGIDNLMPFCTFKESILNTEYGIKCYNDMWLDEITHGASMFCQLNNAHNHQTLRADAALMINAICFDLAEKLIDSIQHRFEQISRGLDEDDQLLYESFEHTGQWVTHYDIHQILRGAGMEGTLALNVMHSIEDRIDEYNDSTDIKRLNRCLYPEVFHLDIFNLYNTERERMKRVHLIGGYGSEDSMESFYTEEESEEGLDA